MTEQFEKFIKKTKEGNCEIIDAQVRMEGEVADYWHRFPAQPRFETFSTSKTFVGIGVGIALEEGLITLDEKIIDAFPEESYDVTTQNASDITVKHLLTMTSGLSETMFWRDGPERRHAKDWVRHFFAHGKFDNEPGIEFLYNNVNTFMLGALIQKKSGKNLREYLRYRLFEPLEIHNPEWLSDPMGRTIAANGLILNADEHGRFGQLLANKGLYNGKRIVSEEFINEMLTTHVSETGEYIPGNTPFHAGYGYHIWTDKENNAIYMWGIFGQYCVILPEKNIVITILSLQDDDGGSNGIYEASPLRKLIWDYLVTQY